MTSLRNGQALYVIQQMRGDGLLQKPLEKRTTLSVIIDLVAGRQNIRRIMHPGEDRYIQGNGVISPTLRRLLKTVAKNKQS